MRASIGSPLHLTTSSNALTAACHSGNLALQRKPLQSATVASQSLKEKRMDKEHVKGTADKAKGAIKDAAGKVTGDKELQSEGKMDKAKGDAHKAAGDVKDTVRKATE